MIIKTWLPGILLLMISVTVFSQSGTIRGSIIDDETGEALIGATAQIVGTSTGSVADLDGNFSISNVQPGAYTIQFSYVSYQTQKVENVVVTADQVTVLNVRLKTEAIGLEEVVVTAEAIKDNEAALLTVQRKSSLVLDAISSRQFSLNGDSDAASAIKRVTGVSVEGGKYVYVRGLGDRYSKTSLNNAEIPGLDPNRNTVQMDLFPSNLLENLVVYKTFSPEIPGNFTGGYVNISTKEFPVQFTVQASGSLGYNTNASFNDKALTYDLGKNHWLGFADKSRDMPGVIKDGVTNISFSDPVQAMKLNQETKSLSTDFNPQQYSPFLNHSFSFSIGDQKTLLGKQIGFIGGISYQRNYEFYENGKVGRFLLPGTVQEENLITIYDLEDTRGKESVLWGVLLNTTVKLNAKHKIGINLIRNQGADASTRYLEGTFPFASGGDPNFIIQTRALEYVERSLTTVQLKGDHVFGGSGIRFDWTASRTTSSQQEPDLRYFNNLRLGSGPEYEWDVLSNNLRPASHYFRDMEEFNTDFKGNFEIPIKTGKFDSKIKFGGSYVSKDREFDERIIQYRNNGGVFEYTGDIESYFADSNLGVIGPGQFDYGLFVRDETAGVGSYTGTENVPAAYAMIDWQVAKSLKISTGARYEGTDIEIANRGGSEVRTNNLVKNDILPAVNITQQLKENTNLRVAYGRTIARPTFRELALFKSFDFQGDFILIGNPELKRTTIDNFDIRWETYPKSGELISASAFYKRFTDPIERAIDPNTNDLATQVFFRNVDEAWLVGMELEFRKRLSFISPKLTNFSFGANFAYIYSRVDISTGELALIRVNDPEAEDQRVMFGQSPYIVNVIFSYDNPESRINANVNYNVQGDRLSVVSTGGTPNVFERSRPVLDFNFKKGLGSKWSIKFSATNLLDSDYAFTHEFKGKTYNYQRYQLGRTFSTGISFLIE